MTLAEALSQVDLETGRTYDCVVNFRSFGEDDGRSVAACCCVRA